MKIIFKIIAILLATLVLLGAGTYAWATAKTGEFLSRSYHIHQVDFPIPFPIDPEERLRLGLDESEAGALARERAVERGGHLMEARYACAECHGSDFGGGVMMDAAPIGRLLGPNLTLGEGGVIADYGPADWDRIVRHGVRPDGTPTAMPSEDFQLMSDQELSDIIVYLQAQQPVNNTVPLPSLGPLGKVLVATGKMPLSVDLIESHDRDHAAYPPTAEVSLDFGRHLAGVCTGCHGQNLAGGKIVNGDPSWPEALNLTPHEDGLGGWSYEDFVRAMRAGSRPDGTALREPMNLVAPYAQRMTDIELQALWAYLQSVPAAAAQS